MKQAIPIFRTATNSPVGAKPNQSGYIAPSPAPVNNKSSQPPFHKLSQGIANVVNKVKTPVIKNTPASPTAAMPKTAAPAPKPTPVAATAPLPIGTTAPAPTPVQQNFNPYSPSAQHSTFGDPYQQARQSSMDAFMQAWKAKHASKAPAAPTAAMPALTPPHVAATAPLSIGTTAPAAVTAPAPVIPPTTAPVSKPSRLAGGPSPAEYRAGIAANNARIAALALADKAQQEAAAQKLAAQNQKAILADQQRIAAQKAGNDAHNAQIAAYAQQVKAQQEAAAQKLAAQNQKAILADQQRIAAEQAHQAQITLEQKAYQEQMAQFKSLPKEQQALLRKQMIDAATQPKPLTPEQKQKAQEALQAAQIAKDALARQKVQQQQAQQLQQFMTEDPETFARIQQIQQEMKASNQYPYNT